MKLDDKGNTMTDGVWRMFTGRNYEKRHYSVRASGKVFMDCWPNAGFMMATDGSGREWPPLSCEIREQEHPLKRRDTP